MSLLFLVILLHACPEILKWNLFCRYTQTASGDMVVRAVVNIKAGDEITTQYRGPNTGNILRRPDFPTNWMFECGCQRCEDPTELGTHASTVR